MATTIKIKNSVTAAGTPSSLAQGELAVNITDKKMWVGNAATTPVQLLGGGLTGDVVGPASATDNAISRFDGTTGKLIQNSLVTISDTGAISAPVDASISGLTVGKGGGAVASNTAVGVSALFSNTTGDEITAVGYEALGANTTGQYNSGFGLYALRANTTGGYNTAVGNSSLRLNTTGGSNTVVGYQSLFSNTTASNNTAVGYQAGYSNTTGTINAFGAYTLYSNTTGTRNTAIGQSSLFNNSTGSNNIAIGSLDGNNLAPLVTNTTGSQNIALGNGALALNTNASNNTAIGHQAGISITTGDTVTALGKGSASTLTTGYAGTYLGAASTASGTNALYEMVICAGNGAIGKGNSTGFISPNSGGVYQGNNSATWSITSDARLKKNIVDNTIGLSAINAIQVRNFEYRTKDEVTDLPQSSAINIAGVQLGAIAQELKEILPDCVKTESTGVMSVNAENLTWYLINAVKELNAKITALENK
jgi:hypothetical protein